LGFPGPIAGVGAKKYQCAGFLLVDVFFLGVYSRTIDKGNRPLGNGSKQAGSSQNTPDGQQDVAIGRTHET
jgi:hypothetical protein